MKGLFGQKTTAFNGRMRRTDGHPATPGTGPPRETCGTCGHIYRRKLTARTYIKCALMEQFWTSGGGTDIRCKDAACKHWTEQKENNDGRD